MPELSYDNTKLMIPMIYLKYNVIFLVICTENLGNIVDRVKS